MNVPEVYSEKLTHYAHHKSVNGFLAKPETAEEIASLLDVAVTRGWRVCPMGFQNSFSDIFLAEGQLHLSTLKMNRILQFEKETGEITVQPGVRIWEVLQKIMPAGFYLTGVSGSYTDTIGGMISSNSHGKDSWKHANCGNNVKQLKLMNAAGEIIKVEKGSALMNATIGGLGMIGIILEITLQPQKLPSYFVTSRDYIIPNTDITAFAAQADFKYIWLDMSNPRKPLSLVRLANFDLSRSAEKFEVPAAKPTVWGMPSPVFWKTTRMFWNRHTYNYCNAIIRAAHSDSKKIYSSTMIDYYYPWRKYPDNCMVFSNNAFHEMQNLFPSETFQQAIAKISALVQEYKIFPLNVNVKWHCADDFFLSFSGNGLCLLTTFESALVTTKAGRKFTDEFMQIVMDMKGKTYLSKYSYITPRQLNVQYSKLNNWLEVKKQTDPHNVFLSDRGIQLFGKFLGYE